MRATEEPGFRIEASGRHRFAAVCTCGWSGRPATTAGAAGTAWDQHVDVEHRTSGRTTVSAERYR